MLIKKETITRTVEETTYLCKCDVCGAQFYSRWGAQSYCSDACYELDREKRRKETIKRSTQRRKERRDAVRAQLPDSTCAYCQQPFRPLRSNAKFCSDACRQKAYRERKEVIAEPVIKTKVVHCLQEPYDIYIGRANPRKGLKASKWKNPFKIGKDGTREEAIEKYKQWFFTQPDLVNSIHELRGKTLGCWCKPDACHGDFLAEVADSMQLEKQNTDDSVIIQAEEQETLIPEKSDKIKVIVFSSPSCGPCRAYKEELKKLEKKKNFAETCELDILDVDENADLARSYGVHNLPTTIILDKDGKQLDFLEGKKTATQLQISINKKITV